MFCQVLNLIHTILEIGLTGEFIKTKLRRLEYFDSVDFRNLIQFLELLAELDYTHYQRIKELLQRKSIGLPFVENHYKKLMNTDSDIHFLAPIHPDFPSNFFELNPCPFGIYVQGSRSLLKNESVAIIGSRKASYFALQESEYIGKHLAK